ncbi:hypothetical protein RHGRI_006384 [Rhododendron griersonianum]|uniref:Protein N-terminal glutamine amidohydrolase n=1 Tax=Rhododendron griersonianum TaxID=479676 RepID=A0AAV6KTA9_9ERIC|nr:hypothetical protein RHGRI_006384 [Rhododendron griersonianum]
MEIDRYIDGNFGIGFNLNTNRRSSSGYFPVSAYPFLLENVYLLCKKLCTSGVADADGSDLHVVFISNEKKQVPLWHQKASHRADGVILWDYHVICIQRKKESHSSPLVWDLDSSLHCPSPLASYVSETIRPSFQLFADFQRFFRVVHAPIFLRSFASDRRHMKDSLGNWTAKPPAYGPIVAEVQFQSLKRYWLSYSVVQFCSDMLSTPANFSYAFADGTVHNLNEYMEVIAADVVSNVGSDSIIAVRSHKLGIVVNETQLEEFFSLDDL